MSFSKCHFHLDLPAVSSLAPVCLFIFFHAGNVIAVDAPPHATNPGPVDGGSDVFLASPGLNYGSPGFPRDPEHVSFPVLIGLFWVVALVGLRLELLMEFLGGVGDVFQEHQGQDNMLVLSGVDVAPEGVRRCPELGP